MERAWNPEMGLGREEEPSADSEATSQQCDKFWGCFVSFLLGDSCLASSSEE